MNSPVTEDKIFGAWKTLILIAPLWWLLGFNLFIYHLTAFYLFLYLVMSRTKQDRGFFVSISAVLIFLFIFIYTFSLVVNAAGAPFSRVLASSYNLSYWIMGFCLVVVLSNVFSPVKIPQIVNIFSVLAVCISGFFLIMTGLSIVGYLDFSIPTLFYGLRKILGETALVEQSVSAVLLVYDWFHEASRARFNALSPYPTATAALIIVIMIMMFGKAENKRRKWILYLLCGLNVLALIFTFSRTSIMAFLLGAGAVTILRRKGSLLWLFVFIALFFLIYPVLEYGMGWILGLRGGSNMARLELYRMSLEQLNGLDWLIGVGVKPRVEDTLYPLGSHSTYISLIFRTGLTGGLVIILLQALLLWRWYKLKRLAQRDTETYSFWAALGWVFISLGFWFLTEDLDAPQLLSFIYFSLVGIFEGFRRELIRNPA